MSEENGGVRLQDYAVNLGGKDYIQYPGILAVAHERGLQSISVELVQTPGAGNDDTAICRATVFMKDGSTFTDYGDASPRNTSSRVSTALIRMASTRAKGRALRDAVNIGETMAEELPEDETGRVGEWASGRRGEGARGRGAEGETTAPLSGRPVPPSPTPPGAECGACGKEVTQGRAASTFKRLGKVVCLECEKVAA